MSRLAKTLVKDVVELLGSAIWARDSHEYQLDILAKLEPQLVALIDQRIKDYHNDHT